MPHARSLLALALLTLLGASTRTAAPPPKVVVLAIADWVIIARLNRATAWVADLQAHVVRVRDTVLVSNRLVELKGLELTRN